jgi:sulfopyruvate decarboxylase subunit beta
MKRFEAIQDIMTHIKDEIIVCNIGFPSRELYQIKDRAKNFYMLGSMGLASSIGLGLAMAKFSHVNEFNNVGKTEKTNEKIIVFDGDGSILMNLGSLVTIFNQNPKNFILIVFDNGCYGSTGNQCTYAQNINLLELAESIGFENCYNYHEINFKDILRNEQKNSIFIHYKIDPGNYDSPIIDLSPEDIKNRFLKAINNKSDSK